MEKQLDFDVFGFFSAQICLYLHYKKKIFFKTLCFTEYFVSLSTNIPLRINGSGKIGKYAKSLHLAKSAKLNFA